MRIGDSRLAAIVLLVALGVVMVGWGMHRLTATTACVVAGGDPCPDGSGAALASLAGGLAIGLVVAPILNLRRRHSPSRNPRARRRRLGVPVTAWCATCCAAAVGAAMARPGVGTSVWAGVLALIGLSPVVLTYVGRSPRRRSPSPMDDAAMATMHDRGKQYKRDPHYHLWDGDGDL